jgi:hypothetical protein
VLFSYLFFQLAMLRDEASATVRSRIGSQMAAVYKSMLGGSRPSAAEIYE